MSMISFGAGCSSSTSMVSRASSSLRNRTTPCTSIKRQTPAHIASRSHCVEPFLFISAAKPTKSRGPPQMMLYSSSRPSCSLPPLHFRVRLHRIATWTGLHLFSVASPVSCDGTWLLLSDDDDDDDETLFFFLKKKKGPAAQGECLHNATASYSIKKTRPDP